MALRCIIALWEIDLWLFCLQMARAVTFPVNFMRYALINHQEQFINCRMTSTGHVSSASKVTCLALLNVFIGTQQYLYLTHPQYCKQNTASTPLSYAPSCNGGSLHQMTCHCHCHLLGRLDMDSAREAGSVMGDPGKLSGGGLGWFRSPAMFLFNFLRAM